MILAVELTMLPACSGSGSDPVRNDNIRVMQVLDEAVAEGTGDQQLMITLPSEDVDFWLFVSPLCTEKCFQDIRSMVTKSTLQDIQFFSEYSMEHAAVYRIQNKAAVEYALLPSSRYGMSESVIAVEGGQPILLLVATNDTAWLSPALE